MSFGWGVGDILAISGLAMKVYSAYKDAPEEYRHISEEVAALRVLINKAAQHFKSATMSSSDRLDAQNALKGCQSVLEDLSTLIEKYKSLESSNMRLAFKRIKLGKEDITALRVRLISNTVLLNGFVRSCEHLEILEIRAQLTTVLGLHRTNSRISIASIASFTENDDTRKAYEQFCRKLYKIGVTEDMIRQKEVEILGILGSQSSIATSGIGGGNISSDIGDQGQLIEAANDSASSKAKPSSRLTSGRNWFRSRFGVGSPAMGSPPPDLPPMGSDAGSLIPTASRVQDTEHFIPAAQDTAHLIPFAIETPDTEHVIPAAIEAQDTERLISANKHIRDNDVLESSKMTAVHKTVQNSRTDIVQPLTGNSNPVGAVDTIMDNPLHLAAHSGHAEIVELLLEEGASIGAVGKDNYTPLHHAALGGHTSVVELLLAKGASVELVTETNNNTPLHLAAWKGHTVVVELLLGKGVSTEIINKGNKTPLHFAAEGGYTGLVELLMAKGASVEAVNKDNKTPLHLAAQSGHIDIVKLLSKATKRVVHGNHA